MLKVLTLSTLFPDRSRPRFGSFVERQTLELAARQDVDLRVIAPIGLPFWPLDQMPHYAPLAALSDHEEWNNISVLRPKFLHIPGAAGRFDAAQIVRTLLPVVKEMRKDFPFDVIDAEFFFPDGPAAVRLGKAVGVPVSIKARGGDIHFWGRNPATRHQVLDAGRKANGLLAVSSALREDMIAMGMDGDRIRVHYTGVDLDLFQPIDRPHAKAGLSVSGPLVVSVGALIKKKRQDILIEALPMLPGVTLALIGQGERMAQYRTKAVALGVADRVRFLGSLGHREIARWLGAADVMALPSASEGLANVWVEALACGTPVVTCDVGGVNEIIRGSESGRIVAANAADFAEAIAALIENPPDRQLVRKAAMSFTWAANTAALYTHLRGLTS